MRAEDLMTREVVTLGPEETIGDALEKVASHGLRHLPVLQDGRLVGVLSDRDLRRVEGLTVRMLGQPSSAAVALMDSPATSLISGPPVTVPPDMEADDLIDRLLGAGVGAVAVVQEDGHLMGIVSYVDILRAARGKL